MLRPSKLTASEIERRLPTLPGWNLTPEGKLHREIKRPDFVSAFGLMASIALVAEALGHHPEWFNVYGTLRIELWTHDAGGLTELDFTLASRIDGLATTHTPL